MSIRVVGVPRRAAAVDLVARVAARAPVLARSEDEAVTGWLVLDPPNADGFRPPDVPTAVWFSDQADALKLTVQVAAVIVPATPGEPVPVGVLRFPDPGVEVRSRPHLTPFLRVRWRQAAGLPERLIVDLWARARSATSELDRARILLADAVAGRGATAVEAIACGAPLVTDPETARRLGLRDGVHALVVGETERGAALSLLAQDRERAAGISRRARRHAEAWLDQAPPADDVVRALTSPGAPPDPVVLALGERLAELSPPLSFDTLASVARCLAVNPSRWSTHR